MGCQLLFHLLKPKLFDPLDISSSVAAGPIFCSIRDLSTSAASSSVAWMRSPIYSFPSGPMAISSGLAKASEPFGPVTPNSTDPKGNSGSLLIGFEYNNKLSVVQLAKFILTLDKIRVLMSYDPNNPRTCVCRIFF